MANNNLNKAKSKKNDEFYTQFRDIEKEVYSYLEYNPDTFRDKVILLPCDDPEKSNFSKFFRVKFQRLGIKKLISTCIELNGEPAKIYVLDRDDNHHQLLEEQGNEVRGNINQDVVPYNVLNGNGDFRSEEITQLRDEADIIVTNPPFSLFREFFSWIMEAKKSFLIIGNQNAITYKEVFPRIKANQVWLGATGFSEDMVFGVPKGTEVKNEYREKAARLGYVGDYTRTGNSCWFTNLDHGRRHTPLPLMSMKDNIKYSSHKELKEGAQYNHYDNYDALEVPYNDSIPSDYYDVMGVPVTFLDRYCPEQFEILGATESEGVGFSDGLWNPDSKVSQATVDGNKVYKRIFIRRKQ